MVLSILRIKMNTLIEHDFGVVFDWIHMSITLILSEFKTKSSRSASENLPRSDAGHSPSSNLKGRNEGF